MLMQKKLQSAAPLLSVYLPVHNGEAHLYEVLFAISSQSFNDFELVICDNASTDSTAELAKIFVAKDPRFKYIRHNQFVTAIENYQRAFLLTNRSSKYCLMAHDDNVYAPTLLERMVSFLERNGDYVACGFSPSYVDNSTGRATAVYRDLNPAWVTVSRYTEAIFGWRSLFNMFVFHFMIRRSAWETTNIMLDIEDFPERYIIAQLRPFGRFYVLLGDPLAKCYSGGIGETGDDEWVRSRSLMLFGEKELCALWSLSRPNFVEKILYSQQFAFVTLRHGAPGTVWRWWLLPAYGASFLVSFLRPSRWRYAGGRYIIKSK